MIYGMNQRLWRLSRRLLNGLSTGFDKREREREVDSKKRKSLEEK
jgi:hypothetical protein